MSNYVCIESLSQLYALASRLVVINSTKLKMKIIFNGGISRGSKQQLVCAISSQVYTLIAQLDHIANILPNYAITCTWIYIVGPVMLNFD